MSEPDLVRESSPDTNCNTIATQSDSTDQPVFPEKVSIFDYLTRSMEPSTRKCLKVFVLFFASCIVLVAFLYDAFYKR